MSSRLKAESKNLKAEGRRFVLFDRSLRLFNTFKMVITGIRDRQNDFKVAGLFLLDKRFICDIVFDIMLVVLDTNVIISGLYSKRGASYQLLRGAISGNLPYAISPLLAFEYEGTSYQKIEEGILRLSKHGCGKILDALFAMAQVVWKPIQIRSILADPSDDKVLECAVSGNCTHIITFNMRHFPKAVTRPYGIESVNPGKFLRLWRDKL